MPFDISKPKRKPEDLKKLVRVGLINKLVKVLGRELDERELALLDNALKKWKPPKRTSRIGSISSPGENT
ncbi:hypothetical protein [Ruegeria arenilitoris]|uniref:hypothetical protein n=1 Tax=Ruegeria arenilitoris TaxID=1173585 RepID=UPI003C7A3AF0